MAIGREKREKETLKNNLLDFDLKKGVKPCLHLFAPYKVGFLQ